MSNSNYYLVSIIIYVISIIQLDDATLSKLMDGHFFSTIDSFLCEQMRDENRMKDLLSTPSFTNIIFYSFGFIDQFLQNPCLDYQRS